MSQALALARAATLVLTRQEAGELQVYLLRRSPASKFMPGLFVFPGGLVDRADGDAAFWRSHQDLCQQGIEARLGKGLGSEEALAYAVAAVRETFEEAGAFLASGPEGALINRAAIEERRNTAGRRPDWLRDEALAGGWQLTLSALAPWAHWITPIGMPRRFDTRFFVAGLPAGQACRPDLHETTEGVWVSPLHALSENLAGRIPLSPPTLVTLQALLKYPTLERLHADLEGRGWGEPIFPRLMALGNGVGPVLIEPWDPMYGQAEIRIDTERLPRSVLPAGEPFSRLWNHGGVWRPVG